MYSSEFLVSLDVSFATFTPDRVSHYFQVCALRDLQIVAR